MGTRHDVWFAIPSASVERCRKVLPVWREMGYKIAILQNRERGDVPADLCVWYDYYPGWPESINILAREIVPKSASIIVSGGCDMLPDPNHSAQELARQFFERFPDGFGVMQPHGDEYLAARRYCGSPFLGRAFVDTMYGGRGPMHGEYHHNYADNELFWVAKGMGVLWERPDLSHFHDHFTRSGAAAPAFWQSVAKNDLRDCMLYYSRAYQRFPGHRPAQGPGVARGWDETLDLDEMLVLARARITAEALKNGAADRVGAMFVQCAERGERTVALYGAGHHTRNAAMALAQPPVRVACIIDDSPPQQGKSLWGIPIVSRDEALRRGVDAVILSGDAVEAKLWDASSVFRLNGTPVYRLYAPTPAEKRERIARAIDAAQRRGVRRLGVYGAGKHTRDVLDLLQASPVPVAAMIDDAPDAGGWPWPVVAPAKAAGLGIDGVIISSDQHERALWQASAPLRAAGMAVLPTYYTDAELQVLDGASVRKAA